MKFLNGFLDKDALLSRYDRSNNGFDLMRFLLAVMVIYGHSHAILEGASTKGDVLARLSGYQTHFGDFAVNCFFIISGFLIAQSFENSNNVWSYTKKRLLRIIPAFLCSLILIAFVLGPLLSKYTIGTYLFTWGDDNPFLFVIKNITFNLFGYSWTPLDLFSANPYAGSANGSMWTLKHEMAAYILLPILFFCFRQRIVIFILTIITIILAIANFKAGFQALHLPNNTLFWVISGYEYNSFIKLLSYFLSGTVIYLFREKIFYTKQLIIFFSLILVAGLIWGYYQLAAFILLPYVIIGIATSIKFSHFNKYGDFSYGLYIYAFPVQQLIVLWWGEYLNLYSHFLLSFIFTLVISYFSWHLVEKKCIQLKYTKESGVKVVFH